MGNVASVSTIKGETKILFAVVNSTTVYSDGFKGCNWYLYDEDGKTISYGYSRGWDKQGAGSRISAMKNARASARRHLKRLEHAGKK